MSISPVRPSFTTNIAQPKRHVYLSDDIEDGGFPRKFLVYGDSGYVASRGTVVVRKFPPDTAVSEWQSAMIIIRVDSVFEWCMIVYDASSIRDAQGRLTHVSRDRGLRYNASIHMCVEVLIRRQG